jgi:mRNA-degrading endonuclease RelE of RelBE toxin-antitoxin system
VSDAFEIGFTEDAKSDVASLDGSIRTQLKKALLKKLAVDPLGYGTSLRAPLVGYYKHEFAAHRIIYRIYPRRGFVVVCAVGPRKQGDAADVYEQLAKLVRSGRLAAQVLGTLQAPMDPNAKTKK